MAPPPSRFPQRVRADVDGRGDVSFRSAGEMHLARQLTAAGAAWEYEGQRFEYTVVHAYVPDFAIRSACAEPIFIEYKGWTPGWADGSDRIKLERVRKEYPELDIRIVFDNDRFARSPIRKGSRTRNCDWAEKHGYPWAVRTVPEEWLEE